MDMITAKIRNGEGTAQFNILRGAVSQWNVKGASRRSLLFQGGRPGKTNTDLMTHPFAQVGNPGEYPLANMVFQTIGSMGAGAFTPLDAQKQSVKFAMQIDNGGRESMLGGNAEVLHVDYELPQPGSLVSTMKIQNPSKGIAAMPVFLPFRPGMMLSWGADTYVDSKPITPEQMLKAAYPGMQYRSISEGDIRKTFSVPVETFRRNTQQLTWVFDRLNWVRKFDVVYPDRSVVSVLFDQGDKQLLVMTDPAKGNFLCLMPFGSYDYTGSRSNVSEAIFWVSLSYTAPEEA